MINKLPKWVWVGSWLLAFVAGIVNVVGFLGFQHHSLTHLTGTTTILGMSLAVFNGPLVAQSILSIGSFLVGTIISGLIIDNAALNLSQPYDLALILEAFLLACSVPLMVNGKYAGIYVASCAIGLQNALMTTFSGAIIRTTHVSGMFTDLGVLLGHALRGRKIEIRKLKLWISLIGSFLAGSFMGAVFFSYLKYYTMIIPAALVCFIGVAYAVFSRKKRSAAH